VHSELLISFLYNTISLIVPTGFYPAKDYPGKLRRIKYYDIDTGKLFVFLTNNFTLPALTITKLYGIYHRRYNKLKKNRAV